MKKIILSLALLISSGVALADEASTAVAVEHYEYGMKIDIAEVISMDAIPNVCEVVPLHLTYRDSQNNIHTLEYLAMGDGCGNS